MVQVCTSPSAHRVATVLGENSRTFIYPFIRPIQEMFYHAGMFVASKKPLIAKT